MTNAVFPLSLVSPISLGDSSVRSGQRACSTAPSAAWEPSGGSNALSPLPFLTLEFLVHKELVGSSSDFFPPRIIIFGVEEAA